ncbi:unnamed protein product [Boreogadus saida]
MNRSGCFEQPPKRGIPHANGSSTSPPDQILIRQVRRNSMGGKGGGGSVWEGERTGSSVRSGLRVRPDPPRSSRGEHRVQPSSRRSGLAPTVVTPTPVSGVVAPTLVSGVVAPTPVSGVVAPTPVSGVVAPTLVSGVVAPTPVSGVVAPTPVSGVVAPTLVRGVVVFVEFL